MKVGLMADSHDRVPAIAALLKLMRDGGATMVLHAGDYVSPLSLKPFEDLHMSETSIPSTMRASRRGSAGAMSSGTFCPCVT